MCWGDGCWEDVQRDERARLRTHVSGLHCTAYTQRWSLDPCWCSVDLDLSVVVDVVWYPLV